MYVVWDFVSWVDFDFHSFAMKKHGINILLKQPQVKVAMTTLLNGSHPLVLSLNTTRGGREAFEQLSCQKQTVAALRQRLPVLECPPFQRV